MAAPLQQQGLDLDMPALVYSGPRSNVMDYLSARGWQVAGVPETELFARAGLPPPERGGHDPLGEITYVSATR